MDEKVIDLIGLEKDVDNHDNLVLIISDHLAWGEETDDVHLFILQNKINDYLLYIESGEVNEKYSEKDYDKIIIRLITKYTVDSDSARILGLFKDFLNGVGFDFEWKTSTIENSDSSDI